MQDVLAVLYLQGLRCFGLKLGLGRVVHHEGLIEDDDKQSVAAARTWRVTSPVTGRKHTGHHGVWLWKVDKYGLG